MCIYIHIFIYVYVYIHVHKCMYIRTCMYIYLCCRVLQCDMDAFIACIYIYFIHVRKYICKCVGVCYGAEIHTCGGPLCRLCGWSYNWYVLLPIATTCMQQHLATHSHLVRWLWLRGRVILRVILRIILGWWWCRASRHHRLLSHYRLRLVHVTLWLQQLFMMLIRGSTVIGRNW